MRAALSILGLVVVLAIVMLLMKQQSKTLLPKPAAGASQAEGAAATPKNMPEAVRQQVDAAMQQGAARASDAQP